MVELIASVSGRRGCWSFSVGGAEESHVGAGEYSC